MNPVESSNVGNLDHLPVWLIYKKTPQSYYTTIVSFISNPSHILIEGTNGKEKEKD